MKNSRWILIVSTLALFSAHQTHRLDAEKPDYARSPAMVRPVAAPAAKALKAKTKKSARAKSDMRAADHSLEK